MNRLILDEVVAYTIYSSDNEKQASAKGTYKNFSIASAKAVGAGWYGSDGASMRMAPCNRVRMTRSISAAIRSYSSERFRKTAKVSA